MSSKKRIHRSPTELLSPPKGKRTNKDQLGKKADLAEGANTRIQPHGAVPKDSAVHSQNSPVATNLFPADTAGPTGEPGRVPNAHAKGYTSIKKSAILDRSHQKLEVDDQMNKAIELTNKHKQTTQITINNNNKQTLISSFGQFGETSTTSQEAKAVSEVQVEKSLPGNGEDGWTTVKPKHKVATEERVRDSQDSVPSITGGEQRHQRSKETGSGKSAATRTRSASKSRKQGSVGGVPRDLSLSQAQPVIRQDIGSPTTKQSKQSQSKEREGKSTFVSHQKQKKAPPEERLGQEQVSPKKHSAIGELVKGRSRYHAQENNDMDKIIGFGFSSIRSKTRARSGSSKSVGSKDSDRATSIATTDTHAESQTTNSDPDRAKIRASLILDDGNTGHLGVYLV